MRAVRLHNSSITLSDTPAPAPAQGHAIIRPSLVALLALDYQVAAAGAASPLTLGHAFVGVIVDPEPDASSPAPRRLAKGRRVVAAPAIPCGRCELCRAGLGNHCRSRLLLGATRDGALAESIALPASALHPVPDAVDDQAASMAVLLGAAVHAAQTLRVEGKPYITVLGDGPLGLVTAQVMSRLNASVRLVGTHPEKFTLAERWSVKHRPLAEVGLRADQDVVVDCTGRPAGLQTAMRLVRPRGKIILMSSPTLRPIADAPAAPPAADGVSLAPLVVNEIELIGCRGCAIDRALSMLAGGEIETAALVSRRLRLDQAPAALFAPRQGLVSLVETDPRRPAP